MKCLLTPLWHSSSHYSPEEELQVQILIKYMKRLPGVNHDKSDDTLRNEIFTDIQDSIQCLLEDQPTDISGHCDAAMLARALFTLNRKKRDVLTVWIGSITIPVVCISCEAVDDLWNKKRTLRNLFQAAFGTVEMKSKHGLDEIEFMVEINKEHYHRCRRKLKLASKFIELTSRRINFPYSND